MPCFFPLQAWRAKHVNESGKRPLVFNRNDGFVDRPVTVPCGVCRGCRVDYSRSWAARCVHESYMYSDNCFLTLTYDDEHLDPCGSLVPVHVTNFFKRLRKTVKFRYFYCGEYGDKFARPHYHVCMFGYYPTDVVFSHERNGQRYYTSDFLQKKWRMGNVIVGNLTFESAAYVARYVSKKIIGDAAFKHYLVSIDTETGDVVERVPEFARMSRDPGLGKPFFDKYQLDLFVVDGCQLDGDRKVPMPRYYDNLTRDLDPEIYKGLKAKRVLSAVKRADDITFDRLRVRAKVFDAKLSRLRRGYESDNT